MTRWITASAAGCALLLALHPADASDAVYTKQPRFRIPYHSEPAELQRLGAREIQLYVSNDRGLSWKLAQAVPPTAGKFAYEAAGDGEYWFAVRTLDGLGRLHPQAGEITPGLKIVVDAQPPDLALALERTGDQVRLSWRASDVNLAPATLTLEYKQPGQESWQPVRAGIQAAGQTTWPAPSTGTVSVRGTVSDLAGNSGEGNAELQIGAAGYAPLPENPALEGPIAEQLGTPAVVPFHMASSRSEAGPASENSPADRIPIVAARPKSPAPSEAQPSPAAPAVTASPNAAASGANAAGSVSDPLTKLVNTRAFQLGYQVDEVGPSGVGSVDFFITEDGGQKWFRYGADSDLKSPFRIDVPAEGSYGFQVRVRSGVGLTEDPPKAGERPAVTVIVDETPPVVSLQPPTQAAGRTSPAIQIRWKVQDAHPQTAKAIDIAHGNSPNGPWTPIATGIDDQGGYDWAVTNLSAAKLFLRLTARDAAGNVGHAVSQEPVTVDLTLPSARITDIEVQPIK